jgi:hypothetical protein
MQTKSNSAAVVAIADYQYNVPRSVDLAAASLEPLAAIAKASL